MFFALASRLIITGTTLFPIYASYKALKSNDVAKMETLLMFWAVAGCIMTVENTVEWVINWIPFYFEVKTLAMLWLTLPQIQGSTYVYVAHLHPFLLKHEHEIDAAIADARTRASQAGLEWIKYALQRFKALLLGAMTYAAEAEQTTAPAAAAPAQNMGPASPLRALAGNLVKQYGPMAVSAGNALFHPMLGREPSVRSAGSARPGSSQQQSALGVRTDGPSRPSETVSARTTARDRTVSGPATLSRAALKAKRAELEAQLASLDAMSPTSPTDSSSSGSSNNVIGASGNESPYRVTPNPRSVSAGPYPVYQRGGLAAMTPTNSAAESSTSSRIERSFVSEGYDEIRPEEASDSIGSFGPAGQSASSKRRAASSSGPSSSWFWWNDERARAASSGSTLTKKRD